MKRKLIEFDAFQRIREESLTNTHAELEAAAPLLAEALGLDALALESFGNDEALFESEDGNFVHAKYSVGDGYVQFDSPEQLVLNEESEAKAAREALSGMLDALIESDESKADRLFGEWMNLPRTKRILSEDRRRTPIRKTKNGKTVITGYRIADWRSRPKGNESPSLTARRSKGKVKKNKARPQSEKNRLKMARKRVKLMKECHVIAENVIGFVDLQLNGPDVAGVRVLRKEGEVVSVRVPTIALRNEARVLSFDWKTMNTDVVVKRRKSKEIHENEEFVKAVAELRKLNALSDSKALETSMENAVAKFPGMVYLTEGELARSVKTALESANETNFDDETCGFIAEGLLRTAHDTFADRISKIVRLAGGKLNEDAKDPYAEFRNIADAFYAKLDESAELEMQAFVDVYESLRLVHEAAREEGNEFVAKETASHLDALMPIVMGKEEQDLDSLGDAAEWLYDVAEATGGEEWKASAPHVTSNGEHPDVVKKGVTPQSPSEMEGSTPAAHHTSDGKDYKGAAAQELEGDGWSNVGGEGTYPELNNPYVPKAEVPTVKGEKSVDADSDQLAQWGDNDTWPNLQNPYSKASVTPKAVKE